MGLLVFGVWQRTGDAPTLRQFFERPASEDATEVAEVPAPEELAIDPGVLGDLGTPPEVRERYPHIIPAPGEKIGPAEHSFSFEGTKHKISVDIDAQTYWGAVAAERLISVAPGETKDERDAASNRYMVQDPVQVQVISDACTQLRQAAKRAGLGRDRYAEFIAKYVQTMPYDYDKLAETSPTPSFPVETLVDETGVCGDKSMLMAALLAHEGYDVALLLFNAENHMAVGIKGPGEVYPGSGYLFIESTSPAYVGEVPEHFVSGIELTSEAVVIPIGTGSLQYEAADRTARILKVRKRAHPAAEKLRAKAERRALTPEQAHAINAKLKVAYNSQFKLSAIDDHESERLDSKKAVSWIKKNCWWD